METLQRNMNMTGEPYPLKQPDPVTRPRRGVSVLPVMAYLILVLLVAYVVLQLSTIEERMDELVERMSVDTEYILMKKEL